MSILEDARALAESGLVYGTCPGRAFAERSSRLMNAERDKSLRVTAALDDDEPYKAIDAEDCRVYEGACIEFDNWAERCARAIEDVEIKTYRIDARAPPPVRKNELLLREGAGLPEDAGELSRSRFNREVGKRVGRLTDTGVDFTRPSVRFLLDIEADIVETQLSFVSVYGRYRKLTRDIPQTEWPCRECDGSGYEGKGPCNCCGGSDYLYKDSVEGFVTPVVTDVMDGVDAKFYGAGREDVDTLALGAGRPLVIRIMEPHRRTIGVEQLEGDISTTADGEIGVEGLRLATYDVVERVRKLDASKECRAAVGFDDDVTNMGLAAVLDELAGATIEQYTPSRVDRRRASITRTRHVYDTTGDLEGSRHTTVEIHGEGGLYIREPVPNDESRTNPSLAGILDTDAIVIVLDVITVGGEDGPFGDDAFFKD